MPWCLGGSALTWLLTGDIARAVSVLMVDFSCALKLSMPLSVLSAMREAGSHKITVKGGKYMEILSQADTIVFDKTGTLTNACPTVFKVVAFQDRNENEMLRIAACLEEHFPHSVANAVVRAALEKGLNHSEMHSEVEYVVAHGIASRIGKERAVIGSGASIAREVADITIAAEDLRELVVLRRLSQRLMGRIDRNYRFVMGFNGSLIALGAFGLLPPATSALLHNGSTLLLSMDCLTPLL